MEEDHAADTRLLKIFTSVTLPDPVKFSKCSRSRSSDICLGIFLMMSLEDLFSKTKVMRIEERS